MKLFFECLENYLEAIVRGQKSIILTGDFNIDKYKHPSKFQTFKDLLNSFGLRIELDAPTRFSDLSESCLDNFLTNLSLTSCSVFQTFVSDHCAISLEIPVNYVNKTGEEIIFRDLSPQSLIELRTRLGWENWSDVFTAGNVDSMYDSLVSTVSHCLAVSCPLKKVKKKKK